MQLLSPAPTDCTTPVPKDQGILQRKGGRDWKLQRVRETVGLLVLSEAKLTDSPLGLPRHELNRGKNKRHAHVDRVEGAKKASALHEELQATVKC